MKGDAGTQRHRTWGWILILVPAAIVRFAGLGDQSLWVDEIYTIISAHVGGVLSVHDLLVNTHGPAYSAALHLWTSVAGDSEWALRFPGAVASLLTIPVLWLITRRLAGEKMAWAAAAALAAAPISIWYAQEARNYSAFLLFLCLALWTWLRLLDAPRSLARIGLHALALFLAFLCNLATLFLIPVQCVWLLGRRRAFWASTVVVWAIVAVLLLPWEIHFYKSRVVESKVLDKLTGQMSGPAPPEFRTTPMGVPFTLYTFAAGRSLGPSFRELHADRWGAVRRHAGVLIPTGILFFGLVARGLLGPVIVGRRLRLQLLAWLLLPPLAVWGLAVLGLKELNPRYALVAFPVFLILLAAGWLGLPTMRARVIAAFLITFLWSTAVFRVHTDSRYRKEDYRAAGEWLRGRITPGTLWITVGIDAPLRHYYLREHFEGRSLSGGTYKRTSYYEPGHVRRFWEGVDEAAERHETIILFESRTWGLDPDGLAQDFIRRRCPAPETRVWDGIRVSVCTGGKGDGMRTAPAELTGGRRAVDHG